MSIPDVLTLAGALLILVELILLVAAVGFLAAGAESRSDYLAHLAIGFGAVGCLLLFIRDALQGNALGSPYYGCAAAISAFCWWWGGPRRRPKSRLKKLGAKSRALIRTLVANLKPSPIRRPAHD